MLIVVKLLLVTFAVFSQGRLFPEKEAVVESELDTMALPLDHPEWVLARRAIAGWEDFAKRWPLTDLDRRQSEDKRTEAQRRCSL